MKTSIYTGMAALAVTLMTSAATAQIQGVITTPEGRKIEGTIK